MLLSCHSWTPFVIKIIREIQLRNNDFFVLIYGFIIKYGGNISILGYITNIISAEDAPPQTNDFAGFYSTINQIMLNLFKEKDKIYILHPIALFY